MLTLTFLGVGSAFAKRNFNANALVEAWSQGPQLQSTPDDNLLIDFGVTGPLALYKLKDQAGFEYLRLGSGINWSAIQRVFVTHLHADHIGGLEELACCNIHPVGSSPTPPFRPQLWSEADLLSALWETSLRGGLGVLDGRMARLEDYFEVHPIRRDQAGSALALMDRYEVRCFPTDHIRVRQKHDWPSLGLSWTDAQSGCSAFFSGDTRFDPQSHGAMMSAASICFHDVELSPTPQPVHAPIERLRTLPPDVRAKTWLYHYNDSWDDPSFAYIGDEFAGFALPGKRYTILD